MDQISQILFLVSDSLLIPDIIVLLILFVRALLLSGSFYNQFITKYKNQRQLSPILETLSPESLPRLQEALPEKDNSLFVKYLRKILLRPTDGAYADYMISNFENEAEKDIVTSKLLSKVGPVLGLIGTLIAMSPCSDRTLSRGHLQDGFQYAGGLRHHCSGTGGKLSRAYHPTVQTTLVCQRGKPVRLYFPYCYPTNS